MDALKDMSRSLRYIAKKYKDETSRLTQLFGEFESLTYETKSQKDFVGHDDIPF